MIQLWIAEIAPVSSTLLAWSSELNKISIVELETKQEFANFDGVKLNNSNSICYFFKLPHHGYYLSREWRLVSFERNCNTKLLVSVNRRWMNSANLEVVDVSRKGQARKIYSFEEVSGCRILATVLYVIKTILDKSFFSN